MMELWPIILILAIVVGGVLFGLIFLLYHQQLLLNEINKRLLVMTTNAVEKYQLMQEEIDRVIDEISRPGQQPEPKKGALDDGDPFDPHSYTDEE